MPTYRLRIELPDRPGALAGVTGVIAADGGNIVSIDVHEVDGDAAIDEIVVEVGDGWAPSTLAETLAAGGLGSLLSSRRMAATEDPVTSALNAVLAMVAGDVTAIDAACSNAVLGLAHGAAVELLDIAMAAQDPIGRLALEGRGTIVTRFEAATGPQGWTLVATDDPGDPHTVAVVTRPLNVRFSATEVSRVEAVLRVRRQLLISRAALDLA